MADKMGQLAQSSSTQTLDLRKTKICPVIKQGMKRCPKGDRCNFAHSNEELRSKPNLSKTKMCPNITKTGHCEMADQCNFAHSELELRSTPNLYKTALCNSFMSGECKLGEYCRFAHGEAELRVKPITEPPISTYFPNGPNYGGGNFMQNKYGGGNNMQHGGGMENNFRNRSYNNRGGGDSRGDYRGDNRNRMDNKKFSNNRGQNGGYMGNNRGQNDYNKSNITPFNKLPQLSKQLMVVK